MEFPDDLIRAFEPAGGHGVVVFVGSGPSCDAGLPSWSELLRRVALDLALEPDVRPSLEAAAFLEAAEYLRRESSEEEVQERVAKEIRRFDSPGAIHDAIVRAPFSAIITTNYDLLLTHSDRTHRFDPPITHLGVTVHDHFHRPFVFHMHGHVNEPRSIVISRKGYDEIVSPKADPARQFLFTVLGGYTVLFVGFGFRDSNVDDILREGDRIGTLGHTTLFGLVPSPPAIDRVREQNLKTRRINPIYLENRDDHGRAALLQWLEELTASVENIAAARRRPVRAAKPHVLEPLGRLLRTSEWRPLVSDAMTHLPRRPDLGHWSRRGFTEHDVQRLFDSVTVDELRQILIHVNAARRIEVIEDALSCLPPTGE
jgi:hypothetical protein